VPVKEFGNQFIFGKDKKMTTCDVFWNTVYC